MSIVLSLGRHEVAGIYWTAWWCESRVFDSFARAVGDAAMKKRRTMTTGSKRRNAPMAARRRKPSAAADANEKIALLEHRLNEALEHRRRPRRCCRSSVRRPESWSLCSRQCWRMRCAFARPNLGSCMSLPMANFEQCPGPAYHPRMQIMSNIREFPGPGTGLGQLVRTKQTVHIRDVVEGSAYAKGIRVV